MNSIGAHVGNTDPCGDKLTDSVFLRHMIGHHQVAVEISVMLQDKTENPIMQNILRKLLWTQRYEIEMMRVMLEQLPMDVSDEDTKTIDRNYTLTQGDFTRPNVVGISDTFCDPMFFDPEAHQLREIDVNDNMYIHHMIPHHQVAVDMSKKLLRHTNNNFMSYLAYRIIRSQQAEIALLSSLQSSGVYQHRSRLLT
jgi:uncharacterized protein (DUF305 family)